MRILNNRIAGAAGLMILLGAFAATPNTANGQNAKVASQLMAHSMGTRLGRVQSGDVTLDSTAVPDLGACQNLQVPAGHEVAFHVYADGVQIYRWNGTTWAFVAPEADLFADPEFTGLVGTHYAGPTWESVSGSKVVGRVLERCTPDPSAIQWLKLEAVYTSGPGVFKGVTFILRVNTVGGLAPTAPGTMLNEEARVPYTTEYYFYKAQD